MSSAQRVSVEFERRFGVAPAWVVRAPGRVNLIGEHTDYNDGYVLPMAIDRAVWIALRPSGGRRVEAYSLDFGQAAAFDLPVLPDLPSADQGAGGSPGDALRHEGPGWAEYLKGVAWALEEASGLDPDGARTGSGRLAGWQGVVAGDVPLGAGLSSSAALEMAAARAFAAVSGLPWEPKAMARAAQRAENRWVGVNCGIMDQMISAAGRAGHALLIDCRSLETEAVPLPPGTAVLVLDTGTRRGLVDSAYNERRAQCEAAARALGVAALRDVGVEAFEAGGSVRDRPQHGGRPQLGGPDAVAWRRARHVVTENDRTLRAAAAMRRGDAAELGRLMDASHASLRDDFEVSSPELDAMVDCAHLAATCLGARMTGAGFGGCAVALVQTAGAQDAAAHVASTYQALTGLVPQAYVCTATDGAAIIQTSGV